jgi:DNA repair protein RadC
MSDEPIWPNHQSALSPRARRAVDKAIRELEAAYNVLNGQALTSPDDTRDYLKCKLYGLPYEVFACLLLDNRHRILRYEELSRGTIDGASVHTREVVRVVMETNAAAVIFSHYVPRHKMRVMCPIFLCASRT